MTDYSWGDGPQPAIVQRQPLEIRELDEKTSWFNWSPADAKFAFILSFTPSLLLSLVGLAISLRDASDIYLVPSLNALLFGVGCLLMSGLFLISLRWRALDGKSDRLMFADSYLKVFSLITFIFAWMTLGMSAITLNFIYAVVWFYILWIPGLFGLGVAIQNRRSESGGMAVGMATGSLCGIICAGIVLLFGYFI